MTEQIRPELQFMKALKIVGDREAPSNLPHKRGIEGWLRWIAKEWFKQGTDGPIQSAYAALVATFPADYVPLSEELTTLTEAAIRCYREMKSTIYLEREEDIIEPQSEAYFFSEFFDDWLDKEMNLITTIRDKEGREITLRRRRLFLPPMRVVLNLGDDENKSSPTDLVGRCTIESTLYLNEFNKPIGVQVKLSIGNDHIELRSTPDSTTVTFNGKPTEDITCETVERIVERALCTGGLIFQHNVYHEPEGRIIVNAVTPAILISSVIAWARRKSQEENSTGWSSFSVSETGLNVTVRHGREQVTLFVSPPGKDSEADESSQERLHEIVRLTGKSIEVTTRIEGLIITLPQLLERKATTQGFTQYPAANNPYLKRATDDPLLISGMMDSRKRGTRIEGESLDKLFTVVAVVSNPVHDELSEELETYDHELGLTVSCPPMSIPVIWMLVPPQENTPFAGMTYLGYINNICT